MAKRLRFIAVDGSQYVVFYVENDNTMAVSTAQTKFKKMPLYILFNKKEVDKIMDHVKNMNEEEFNNYVIKEFKGMGYKLKSYEENEMNYE